MIKENSPDLDTLIAGTQNKTLKEKQCLVLNFLK